MSWFDKLKALINLEINSPLVSVNLTKNSNSHNTADSREYSYDPQEKRLDVYLDKISSEKKEQLKSILNESIQEGNTVLERNTSKLLYKLNDFRIRNTYRPILDFFRNIISVTDYEALEAALFLREVFTYHGDVTKLKKDMLDRFGERGKNIANLCTAGYFEEFLMPLYNSSKERFDDLYDIIVSKSPFAVFVHSQMTPESITLELKNKVEISKRYGIKFIHIHGIGERNVHKVKEFIRREKAYFKFFEKEIYEKDNIIIVELLL